MMSRTSELLGADVESGAEFGPSPLPFHHQFAACFFLYYKVVIAQL